MSLDQLESPVILVDAPKKRQESAKRKFSGSLYCCGGAGLSLKMEGIPLCWAQRRPGCTKWRQGVPRLVLAPQKTFEVD